MSEYAILEFSVNDSLRDVAIREKFQKQIYIVINLKINMLIEFDILDSQKIYLNYKHEQLIIDSCKRIAISIIVISVKNKINKVIRTLTIITVLSRSSIMIPMHLRDSNLLQDRNFIFLLYQ